MGVKEAFGLLLQSLALSGPQNSVIPWDNYCHHKSRQILQGIVPANKEGLCGGVKGLGQMQPIAVPDFVAVFLAGQSHSFGPELSSVLSSAPGGSRSGIYGVFFQVWGKRRSQLKGD